MENIKTAQVYKQMLKWQLLATVSVAVLAFILAKSFGAVSGQYAAISALAGGMSAVFGGLAGAMIARRGDKKNDAGAILITMLKAEAVKIFVIALLLFLTFKLYNEHLVPIALILGLAASAILSGAAFFGLDKK
ncbi:MAG: ATP synthase subunit I [Candidatus Methylopumilus sp.]|jgi:ATP synthase protein I